MVEAGGIGKGGRAAAAAEDMNGAMADCAGRGGTGVGRRMVEAAGRKGAKCWGSMLIGGSMLCVCVENLK